MRKRKGHSVGDFFQQPEIPVHIFRAGDVVRILGIEKWRLEKFLTGKQYDISASGHLGKGLGSWRLFSHGDLYRIGIATLMAQDGFSAKFVSLVLKEIDSSELLGVGESGHSTAADLGLFRSDTGPEVRYVGGPGKQQPYYVIKLRELIEGINKRISRKGEQDGTHET
jgi:hypothetical protein